MNVVKNDLFDYGLKIYQNKDAFKFSLDSILLAEFVEKKKDIKTIVDFCTGNGAVPLILSTKFNCKLMGFEIQKNPYDLAYNSVVMNNLEDKIKIIHDDLANALEYILPETVDVVTVNPPYFKYDPESNINMEREKAIARHEIETNLDNIFRSAKYILKNKGTLYMVHRPERLSEIINIMGEYKFAVKRLQFIYSDYNKSAIMVLIKATKNGLEGVKVNPPINVMKHITYKNIFG